MRAPDTYWTVIGATRPLTTLRRTGQIQRGFTTGCNEFFYLDDTRITEWGIEDEFVATIIDSPRGCYSIRIERSSCIKLFVCHKSKAALRNTQALEYIKWGEEQGYNLRKTCQARNIWYDLGPRPHPVMVWPRTFFERHVCYDVPRLTYCSDRFYGLTGVGLSLTVRAFLNSTLMSLLVETDGYQVNHGGIDTSVWWLAGAPVLTQRSIEAEQAFEAIRKRGILLCEDELKLPDRHELDGAILNAIGLPRSFLSELYETVSERVKGRILKARRGLTQRARQGAVEIGE